MKRLTLTLLILVHFTSAFTQQVLTSWSQQNIENYTKEMYDAAQLLSADKLSEKNRNDKYWSEVFLTLNAAVNNYSQDTSFLKSIAHQLTDKTETKLAGTSRLIIWDRIIGGDITFEGKGLIIENDLYTIAGRANQILQNTTQRNFGFVSIKSTPTELENLKNSWLAFLSNHPVKEYIPEVPEKAEIPEISNLRAFEALVLSLQNNPAKTAITTKCLQTVYGLDKMPEDKGNPASHCNPDTYTYAYLAMLIGDKKFDEAKDAKWWMLFWNKNKNNLVWNPMEGIYIIKD